MKMQKIIISMFVRSFFIQSLWNFERLQNIGFLFVLKPYLDKIYRGKENRKQALLRHTGFFNTHPYMANVIVAITANMEKETAENKGVPKADVNMMKNSLAGPLAAIGDSFYWGTVRPAISFFCILAVILFARAYSPELAVYAYLIPLFFVVAYNFVHIPVRYWFLTVGFKFDKQSITLISGLGFKFFWKVLKFAAVLALLISIALYFKSFGFGAAGVDFFGSSVPAFAVFALVFALSFIFGKKSSTFLFYMVVFTCIIMAHLGM